MFSAAISDLGRAKELLHDLFASHALTVFVFWSGLPLASNGVPSTHKSHLYTSFDPPSPFPPPCFFKCTTSLFKLSYFLSQKAAREWWPSFLCSWKGTFTCSEVHKCQPQEGNYESKITSLPLSIHSLDPGNG